MVSSNCESKLHELKNWLGERYSLEHINITGEELVEATEIARNEVINEVPQFKIFQQETWPDWILNLLNTKKGVRNSSHVYNLIKEFIEEITGTISIKHLKDIEEELGRCNSSLWRLYIEYITERSRNKIKNKPTNKTDARILHAWLRELARVPTNNSIMIIAKTMLHIQDEIDKSTGEFNVRIGPESILYTYAHMYHELGLKSITHAGYKLAPTHCVHDINPVFTQVCANNHGENNFTRKIAKAVYPILHDTKNLYKAYRIYFNLNSKVVDPNYLYAARGHEQIIIFGGNPFEIKKVADLHKIRSAQRHSTLARTLFIDAMESSGFKFSDELSIHIDITFKTERNVISK